MNGRYLSWKVAFGGEGNAMFVSNDLVRCSLYKCLDLTFCLFFFLRNVLSSFLFPLFMSCIKVDRVRLGCAVYIL